MKTSLNHDKQQHQTNPVRNKEMNSFDEDLINEKRQRNDGSHFRLFYKSNTPERSISHQLEHRYFKNPNSNLYTNGLNVPALNQYFTNPSQYNGGFAFNDRYAWPLNKMNPRQKSYSNLENKSRQTMLNIHYHGQNTEDFDGKFSRHFSFYKFSC